MLMSLILMIVDIDVILSLLLSFFFLSLIQIRQMAAAISIAMIRFADDIYAADAIPAT